MATSTRKRSTSTTKRSTATAARAAARPKATSDAPEAPADPAPEAPEPTVVSDTAVTVAGPTLKKPEFIDRVVARGGLKKKDVKPAVEAALDVLAEAIAAGEELQLQGFGKLKVTRHKALSAADVFTVKLRRPKAQEEG